MSQIHLAIAADFTLAEKLLEALENSNLTFDKVSAVEIEPFGEEQNLRFGTKAVEQFELDNLIGLNLPMCYLLLQWLKQKP